MSNTTTLSKRELEAIHSHISSVSASLDNPISITRLQSSARIRPLINLRYIISKAMRNRNYSLAEIGHVLNRTHGAIHYLLRDYEPLTILEKKSNTTLIKKLEDLL